jgi:cell division protein FtsL
VSPARFVLALLLIASASPVLAAPPGTAQNFLDRANRIKAKGPLAVFDADYRRLKAQATAAGQSIRNDRIAAEKAGRPILYCSPKARAQLGSMEFIDGLEAIPPGERASMSLKQAMLRILQKKYPCRR